LIPGLLLAVVCVLLLGTPAVALEVQVKDLRAPASVVTTTSSCARCSRIVSENAR
jgi:hypothetical protein